MAVPLALWLCSVQCLIASDVAGVCFAAIADEHDVSIIGMIAVVAHPIQVFLLVLLILILLGLHLEFLAFKPVEMHICAAIWATVGVTEPSK